MKLLIARHGETVQNAQGIAQGQMHGELSDLGRKQAQLLAKRLEKEHIDVIFSSDLGRAANTANIIAKSHRLKPILNKDLRERDYGMWQGSPRHEVKKAIEKSGFSKYEFKPEQGESYKEVSKRAAFFISMLKKKYHDKTVLVVTHGGILKLLIAAATNQPMEKAVYMDAPQNCSLTIIDITDKGSKVIAINDVSHL